VPVRVGDQILGYLSTGQIALRKLTTEDFSKVLDWLRQGGAKTDFQELERAFFETKLVSREQYDAILKLLEVFAQHLSIAAEQIATQEAHAEPPMVQRARKFIEEHQTEDLALEDVAKAVNASTFHFCKMFKRATGMTFTEYLALVRVAKAKKLLANPQMRISEVAFESGFSSITHFNRTFRKLTGQSPTNFRRNVSGVEVQPRTK
jgi:AraC-like DNA-binding protein